MGETLGATGVSPRGFPNVCDVRISSTQNLSRRREFGCIRWLEVGRISWPRKYCILHTWDVSNPVCKYWDKFHQLYHLESSKIASHIITWFLASPQMHIVDSHRSISAILQDQALLPGHLPPSFPLAFPVSCRGGAEGVKMERCIAVSSCAHEPLLPPKIEDILHDIEIF